MIKLIGNFSLVRTIYLAVRTIYLIVRTTYLTHGINHMHPNTVTLIFSMIDLISSDLISSHLISLFPARTDEEVTNLSSYRSLWVGRYTVRCVT